MTIVEAASQGAPSLVAGGGHVGATDLLSESGGEVVCCDMGAPACEVGAGSWWGWQAVKLPGGSWGREGARATVCAVV